MMDSYIFIQCLILVQVTVDRTRLLYKTYELI